MNNLKFIINAENPATQEKYEHKLGIKSKAIIVRSENINYMVLDVNDSLHIYMKNDETFFIKDSEEAKKDISSIYQSYF